MALPLFSAPSSAPGGHPRSSSMVPSSPLAPSSTSRQPPLQTINTSPTNHSRYAIRVKLPIPARTRARQATSANAQSPSLLAAQGQAIDRFFGQSSGRRDKGPRQRRKSVFADDSEPETIAKYLFRYGFVFPPFWLIGSFILFMPLRAPDPENEADAASGTTIRPATAGRQAHTSSRSCSRDLALTRLAERRWSRRCIYAWVLLMLSVAVVVVVLWITRVGVFSGRS